MKHVYIAWVLLSSLFLTNCTPLMVAGGATVVDAVGKEKAAPTLLSINYAAADLLASQGKYVLPRYTNINLVPLDNLSAKTLSPVLGHTIVEQIGSRFVQLGYRVRPPQSKKSFARNALRTGGAISGTYALTGRNVLVHLNMIENKTGRMIATYDYTLPLSREVRTLAHKKPTALNYVTDIIVEQED